jgi:hypothetical protein
VTITSISFSLVDYSETDNCNGVVPAQGTCTVQVAITPQALGLRQGDITINFAHALAQVVTLQATAVTPLLVMPSSLDFGPNVPVGATSSLYFFLENPQFVAQAYSLAVTDDFTIHNTCPNPTPANMGCAITVVFQPKTPGVHNGTVTVSFPGITEQAVVTLTGATPSALRFVPITPCRAVDTRKSGGPIYGGTSSDFALTQGPCNIPDTAAAYSLNVGVVPQGPLSYITVWPTAQTKPVVSTLNSLDGRIKSNAAIVPAGANGDISIFATNTTDVILDVNGYFVPATQTSALAFYTMTPCRLVDTRGKPGPLGGPSMSAKETRDFPLSTSTTCPIPSQAQAYSLNFTVVPQAALGYLTAWPVGQDQPLVATVNDPTGTIAANAAIVPAGTNGDVNVYVTANTNVIVDVNGYFAPMNTGGLSLYAGAPCRVLDTRQTTGTFSGRLTPPVNVVNGPCGVPSTAQAFVFNTTALPQGPLGYLTLWPDGQQMPVVSTLNAVDGWITNNMALVPTQNGSVDAYASGTTNLILDIFGYFAP